MDSLKQNRLIVTLIVGVLGAAAVFFLVAGPVRGEASEATAEQTDDNLSDLERDVADAPSPQQVAEKRATREGYLKGLIDQYRYYQRMAYPLREYRMPGEDDYDENASLFGSQLETFLRALQTYYEGGEDPETEEQVQGFRSPIPVTTRGGSRGPQNQAVEDAFRIQEFGRPRDASQFALYSKRLIILMDLTNIIRNAALAEAESATDDAPAYLQFSDSGIRIGDAPTADVNGLIQRFEYEFTLQTTPEIAARIIAALHTANPNLTRTQEGIEELFEDAPSTFSGALAMLQGPQGNAPRFGVRFDDLSTSLQMSTTSMSFVVSIPGNGDEIFDAEFEPRSTYRPTEGGEIFPGEGVTPGEFTEDIVARLYDAYRDEFGPDPQYVTVRFIGSALDFLFDDIDPNVEMDRAMQTFYRNPAHGPNFWSRLNLTPEQIAAAISNGVDPELEGDENESDWNECLVTGTDTPNRQVQLPYAMAIPRDDPDGIVSPTDRIYLSDEGLRLVAGWIYEDRIANLDDEYFEVADED